LITGALRKHDPLAHACRVFLLRSFIARSFGLQEELQELVPKVGDRKTIKDALVPARQAAQQAKVAAQIAEQNKVILKFKELPVRSHCRLCVHPQRRAAEARPHVVLPSMHRAVLNASGALALRRLRTAASGPTRACR
jgi:hypothetical protein